MIPAVFCLAKSRGIADCIILELKQAGFLPAEVAVLFRDRTPRTTPESERQQCESLGAAFESAGAIRGVLAWIAGVAKFERGGESWIAAGPLGGALQGAAADAASVPIARILTEHGLAAADAARYDHCLRFDGLLLVAAFVAEPRRLEQACSIIRATRGHDVSDNRLSVRAASAGATR